MRVILFISLGFFSALILSMNVEAQSALSFESSEKQATLLELFTSEGCSSCPPAEHWLTGLAHSSGLWKEFVPVAFHVDYWDYLGWRDAWASERFSERQRAYSGSWRSDSIYTPGFVVNGKEWRRWSLPQSGPPSTGATAGILKISSTDLTHWTACFTPSKGSSPEKYEVHVVTLLSGVSSDVKAGENRGRRLVHDFIALHLMSSHLNPADSCARGEFSLEPHRANSGGRLAIAAWITRAGSLEPIQAVGGWLPPPVGK